MTTPLLEIATPDPTPGNPSGGLPVDPLFSGNILTAELSEWLDQDAMDMYGISVSQSEEDGIIYAYIPLALIQDQVGDTPVAWGGRMYYRPSSSVWGGNHRARLIWMISALVDTCNTDAKPAVASTL